MNRISYHSCKNTPFGKKFRTLQKEFIIKLKIERVIRCGEGKFANVHATNSGLLLYLASQLNSLLSHMHFGSHCISFLRFTWGRDELSLRDFARIPSAVNKSVPETLEIAQRHMYTRRRVAHLMPLFDVITSKVQPNTTSRGSPVIG